MPQSRPWLRGDARSGWDHAATCGWCSARAQERPRAASGCGGETLAAGSVTRVLLGDGREIRLAGIEVPPLPQSPQKSPAPGGAAARDALAALLDGAQVRLKQAAPQKTDRYGRVVAHAIVTRNGVDHTVQSDLVAAGYARVSAQVGSRACAMELLRSESMARKAKLGLWASSYYDLLNADNPTEMLAEQGRFALVEGKVLSVRESGATIYVNFGRRWTEDFTVTILKRNERNFTAAGLEPKTLAGRHIRVRGWIEERGGPWIEAARPEQIEFADREEVRRGGGE